MYLQNRQFNHLVKLLTSKDGEDVQNPLLQYIRKITVVNYLDHNDLDYKIEPSDTELANYLAWRLLGEVQIKSESKAIYKMMLFTGLSAVDKNLDHTYIVSISEWLLGLPLDCEYWEQDIAEKFYEITGEDITTDTENLWHNYLALAIVNYVAKFQTIMGLE